MKYVIKAEGDVKGGWGWKYLKNPKLKIWTEDIQEAKIYDHLIDAEFDCAKIGGFIVQISEK